jgi:aminomethyltransferase
MGNHTPLFDAHLAANAKMVDFGGWDMPLNYGSQLEEHHAVRGGAGVFDVSHMTVIDVSGPDTQSFLRHCLANDIARLDEVGGALYTVLLNESAGIVDDLIVYRRAGDYRLVVNAGTREAVLANINAHAAAFDTSVVHRGDLAMLAVQGPTAVERFVALCGIEEIAELAPFRMLERDDWMVARTGYTGEDGVELLLPDTEVAGVWTDLLAAGVAPAGLAARDTLRLEAGLNLYGQDMDGETHPLEANLGWTIAWQPDSRDFVGRDALSAIREAGSEWKLTGIVLDGRGVMRHGYRVVTEAGEGTVTSGIFSPTLGYSVALARVPRAAAGACEVEIRGRHLSARLVRPPFVRNGVRVHK